MDRGLVVDEHLQTVHPDVYAIGDIASFLDPIAGRIHVHLNTDWGKGTRWDASDHLSIPIEGCAVAETFKADVGLTPINVASHVRADGRERAHACASAHPVTTLCRYVSRIECCITASVTLACSTRQ